MPKIIEPLSQELMEEICNTIATTTYGLKKLCRLNTHWPPHTTIVDFRIKNPVFGELYARSKQAQVEALVDEILDIADDATNDYSVNDKGEEVLDREHIQRSRVRIDSRKWIASKLAPKLYGDKIIINDKADNGEARRALEIALKCMTLEK